MNHRVQVVATVVFVVAGCRPTEGPPGSHLVGGALDELAKEGGSPITAVAPAGADRITTPPGPCTIAPDLVAGVTRTLPHEGLLRTYSLDLPEKLLPGSPLILFFHGWGGDPDQLERTSSLGAAASARGYVVARPLGFNKAWNAGTCCGKPSALGIDDVSFARALVARLSREACIDPRRVYAAGFSNGGFLSHRIGCEAAELVRAVASVSGTFGIDRCAPSRPVSMLHIHGKKDGIVKFGGTEDRNWSSVARVIETWRTVDKCGPAGAEEATPSGLATCVRAGCAEDTSIMFCRDELAGHTWMGGPRSKGPGSSKDLDATKLVLDFFDKRK